MGVRILGWLALKRGWGEGNTTSWRGEIIISRGPLQETPFLEKWTWQPLLLRFFNHLLHCFQAWLLGVSLVLNLFLRLFSAGTVSNQGGICFDRVSNPVCCLLIVCSFIFSVCPQTNKSTSACYWRGTVFWSCCCCGDFSFLENCCWRLSTTDNNAGMRASIYWTTTKVHKGIFTSADSTRIDCINYVKTPAQQEWLLSRKRRVHTVWPPRRTAGGDSELIPIGGSWFDRENGSWFS